MRRNTRIVLITVLVPILCAVTVYRILESPSRILRHALHLRDLPSSISNLRMGTNIWTNEVRGFYFDIAPRDFPTLLTGRHFYRIDPGGTFEAQAAHLSPPVSLIARWRYRWETEGAYCELSTNEDETRVVAVFAAD
jgi:hypothetical protein